MTKLQLPQSRVEKFTSQEFDRKAFSCTEEALNEYLCLRVGQDIRKRLCQCFVWPDASGTGIVGYYTLAAASVSLSMIPDDLAKKIRYPHVPVALIGRLAVDQKYAGQGAGGVLIADAAKRVAGGDVGAWAIVVNPKKGADTFYAKYGFLSLQPPEEQTMFLPIPTNCGSAK